MKINFFQKTDNNKVIGSYLFLLFAATICSILISLLHTPSSYAASDWDNNIRLTSTLEINSANGLHYEDVTSSYLKIMSEACPLEYSSLVSTMQDENSKIAITKTTYRSPSQKQHVGVGWASVPPYPPYFGDGQAFVVVEHAVMIGVQDNGDYYCDKAFDGIGDMLIGHFYTSTTVEILVSNFPITMPTGYAGPSIPSTDNSDSDGDGLSNYIESAYYPLGREIFCNTSTDTCAPPDPYQKDLYLEIDWMTNWLKSYKPTNTQLGLVGSKFAAIGVNFHADTGQFGGGNSVNYQAPLNVIDDYYPYKYGTSSQPANFDAKRLKIWRYMISGNNFTDTTPGSLTASGKAEGGGDDMFLSYGLLENKQNLPAGLDNAVAGTIIHELGHTLCLTPSIASYTGQDTRCVFDDIDSELSSLNYHSAMNYQYQFTNTYSFSSGLNGLLDHDDITAINYGFNDFVNSIDTYTP